MMDLVLRFITAGLVVSSFVVLSDVLNPRVLRFAPYPPPREVLWRRLQHMFPIHPSQKSSATIFHIRGIDSKIRVFALWPSHFRRSRFSEDGEEGSLAACRVNVTPSISADRLAQEDEVRSRSQGSFRALWAVAAAFVVMLALASCNQNPRHPDVKYKVDTAMTQNNLGVVTVSQDRDKGVITLTGDVENEDQKAQATNVAAQAAPGYAISNELGVRPVGQESQAKAVDSSLDSAIEDNFKASLKAPKNLDQQHISYDAKNGTLVLKGSVKTPAQREEAQKLAKAVPSVKEVVNEIQVR